MVVLRLVQAIRIHYGAVMDDERKAARGSAGKHLTGGFGEQGWLGSLLGDATGVDDGSSSNNFATQLVTFLL